MERSARNIIFCQAFVQYFLKTMAVTTDVRQNPMLRPVQMKFIWSTLVPTFMARYGWVGPKMPEQKFR